MDFARFKLQKIISVYQIWNEYLVFATRNSDKYRITKVTFV